MHNSSHNNVGTPGTSPCEIVTEAFSPHRNKSYAHGGNDGGGSGGGKDSRQNFRGNNMNGMPQAGHYGVGATNMHSGGNAIHRPPNISIRQSKGGEGAVSNRGDKVRQNFSGGSRSQSHMDNSGFDAHQLSRGGHSNNHAGHYNSSSSNNIPTGGGSSMCHPAPIPLNFAAVPNVLNNIPNNAGVSSVANAGDGRQHTATKVGAVGGGYLNVGGVGNFATPGISAAHGPGSRGILSPQVALIADGQQLPQEVANNVKQNTFIASGHIPGMGGGMYADINSHKMMNVNDVHTPADLMNNNAVNGATIIVSSTPPLPVGNNNGGNNHYNHNNGPGPVNHVNAVHSGSAALGSGTNVTQTGSYAGPNRVPSSNGWQMVHQMSGGPTTMSSHAPVHFYSDPSQLPIMLSQSLTTMPAHGIVYGYPNAPPAPAGTNSSALNEQIALSSMPQPSGHAVIHATSASNAEHNAHIPLNLMGVSPSQMPLTSSNTLGNNSGSVDAAKDQQPAAVNHQILTHVVQHPHHPYSCSPVIIQPPFNSLSTDDNSNSSNSTPAYTVNASTANSPSSYDDDAGTQSGITFLNENYSHQTGNSVLIKNTSPLSNSIHHESKNSNSPSHHGQSSLAKMRAALQGLHPNDHLRLANRIYEE